MDQLLRDVVEMAIVERASDVHIEPQAGNTLIKFRIDGSLRVHMEVESHLHRALILRLKIISRMAVDQPHIPQDGKWSFVAADGKRRDIRVSLIPFFYGEGAVLRILMGFSSIPSLNELGFDGETASDLSAVVRGPDGLLLLTGPTGCGKSTTVHGLLAGLNNGTRKIIAVEDPVEYAADGINSVQIDEAKGLGFVDVLRAVLRQSPNVLFVGEIRDEATAAVAVQASMTGHFVCSTLHCRDAAGAVARLLELKIPKHLIENVLRGVLSQRLVRCLCEKCKERRRSVDGVAAFWGGGCGDDIYHPVGCSHCAFSGYHGQTAIYEWMPLLAGCKLSSNVESNVVLSLRDCAKMKVFSGITSPEEAYAVTC
jgi:type II secretory ATPase GspE/PulE/Tfp pilus assembly ATPase PilB-like protein